VYRAAAYPKSQEANMAMRQFALPLLVIVGSTLAAQQGPESVLLIEAKSFMAAYGEDLKAGKRQEIANRYDPEGAYRVGNGAKVYKSFETIRESYLGKWKPPVRFEWHDLSYEVVGPNAVLVIGRFDWGLADKTVPLSYTGLLVRRGDTLKIRLEDESAGTPKPLDPSPSPKK
jgi:hypothetical protein